MHLAHAQRTVAVLLEAVIDAGKGLKLAKLEGDAAFFWAPGGDARCAQAVDLFFALLGTVAGNLALSLGARGGMYIGGGIVPRLGERIDRSSFRERFEAKGRFRDYLRGIPTYVVQASTSPALLGAARALDEL